MPRLAISGSDSAVDTSTVSGPDSVTVNPDAAVKLSPISDRTAVTLADNATVEVINGKLPGRESHCQLNAALLTATNVGSLRVPPSNA
jgi:hypothetical protein